VLDRLGYGASGRPDGDEVCYGSEADYVSQIAQQLRAGTYTARGPAPRFDRLALAGHSAGGFMVETAATSFGGIDALVVLAFGNTGASPTALSTFFQTQLTCQSGMAEGGYTFFGATEQDFRAAHLNTVEPRIADLVAARRAKDPCGDTGAAAQTIATDVARNNEVRVPVLVVTGSEDVLFPPPAGPNEAALFSGSPDVTQVTVEGGHALTFNRSAPQFRKVVADWLARRGL
jgi:pimeloyl-ACP methyl ester carboxylesterase